MTAPAPDVAPTPRLSRVLREFFATEVAGGLVLLAAAVAAIVWVNSPFGDSYETLWRTELSLRVGDLDLRQDLRHWVNEALMAIFFLVVGLEIKRELVAGELRSWRHASMPAIAALGGMVVPAAVYLALNVGKPGSSGWGIPMATDIAFALGVAALLGRRVPTGLKLFLLTLAIVDDIGAIIVIALFYSSDVRPMALLAAGGILAGMALLRALRVYWMPAYVVLGAGVWLAVFESGVHATIAGVVLGLLAPARPQARSTMSVAERLELVLHPYSSLGIVPLFALANAGVVFDGDALRAPGASAVALGVALGLVVGKIVGVSLGAYLAVRLGIGVRPDGVTWRHVFGASALAGIGFTVSLFITDLAFDADDLRASSKIGIVGASVAASLIGALVLWSRPGTRASAPIRPPKLGGSAR